MGAAVSKVARWSYANTATVRPYLGRDQWSKVPTYGPEYTIACTWTAEAQQVTSNDGAQFVSRYTFWTEDARPKFLDQIRRSGAADWEEVRAHTQWDMSMFQDVPDYKLVT